MNDCKIFVGNVPYMCTQEEFSDAFKHIGGFVSADLIFKQNTEREDLIQPRVSRGFGFVVFKDKDSVRDFMSNNHILKIRDRVLRFTPYTEYEKNDRGDKNDKKEKRENNYFVRYLDKNNIFIKNIPTGMTSEQLKACFNKITPVGLCYINTNINTGETKNTGVVEIIDPAKYTMLIKEKIIEIEYGNSNKALLELCKFRQSFKSENKTDMNLHDIYKLAFNAGRNYEKKSCFVNYANL